MLIKIHFQELSLNFINLTKAILHPPLLTHEYDPIAQLFESKIENSSAREK